VFISDLGRRALTTHRLLGQLMIAAGLGEAHLTAFATSGVGLELKLASAGTGARLGLFASGFLRVEHDPRNGKTFSRVGIGYALIWIATAAEPPRVHLRPPALVLPEPPSPGRYRVLFAGADANPCVTILTEDRAGRMRLASSSGRTRRRSAGETRAVIYSYVSWILSKSDYFVGNFT
jgi:hypothetical protein